MSQLNFCTLFDSGFLGRGIALYESLLKHEPNAHLYVVAFDDRSYQVLKEEAYSQMTVISLSEFEDPDLLKVKTERSQKEYCWTCTPSVIKYVIEKYNLPSCTYLDADLYFYASPASIFQEIGDKDVLITEHNYSPKYDQTELSGKYCVQFNYFKNSENGMKVLHWWRERCIEWCSDVPEEGKFGDQKYLDDWTERFEKVHVLREKQKALAPWNVQQYKLKGEDMPYQLKHIENHQLGDLVFYHFHHFTFHYIQYHLLGNTLKEKCVIEPSAYGFYDLDEAITNHLYGPYKKHLLNIEKRLSSKYGSFRYNAGKESKVNLLHKLLNKADGSN